MRNRVLLLCIAIVCSVLSGYAQSYYFKHLGIADGLSQVRITAVCQDKTGAVWLGSSEGLNRYNGNDVRLFHPSQNSEGLTNNEINELCADNVGNVYINAGFDLVRLNVETETFTCLRKNDVRGISTTPSRHPPYAPVYKMESVRAVPMLIVCNCLRLLTHVVMVE